MDQDEDMSDIVDEDEDDADLRRRTFLERHDWIPWIAGAILLGGALGTFQGQG